MLLKESTSLFTVTESDESVSEELFRRGLCLPGDTGMKTKDVDRVCGVIRPML